VKTVVHEVDRRCVANPIQSRTGVGEIFLESAAPEIGAEWTDSNERSEARGLKHREAAPAAPCCARRS
jgi:hypothetical protein